MTIVYTDDTVTHPSKQKNQFFPEMWSVNYLVKILFLLHNVMSCPPQVKGKFFFLPIILA